jgi:hypothetical protein
MLTKYAMCQTYRLSKVLYSIATFKRVLETSACILNYLEIIIAFVTEYKKGC